MTSPSNEQHMLWTHVDGIAVGAHDAHRPSEAEWNAWLDAYRVAIHTLRGVLIYTLGGGPSGLQRAALLEIMEQHKRVPPAHIITSSVAARGIVTAMCWFLPPARRMTTHAPRKMDDAFDALNVEPMTRAAIRKVIDAHLATLAASARASSAG